jgi:hypothetical protein
MARLGGSSDQTGDDGFSPFLISLGWSMGVFVARWTIPVALKGTSYVWADLREKPHLIVWESLPECLWAGREHANGIRHSECRPVGRVSVVERQQPRRHVLGLVALQ